MAGPASSYYTATVPHAPLGAGALQGSRAASVCVVGGGFAGLNTTRRMMLDRDWSNGSINRNQLGQLEAQFAQASPDALRIVVAHHPLMEPEGPEDTRNSLRIGLIGNPPPSLQAAFERRFGVVILDTYGMTECEPLTVPAAGQPPGGTPQQPPVFRGEAVLVAVPVFVTDGSGKAVPA